MANPLNEIMPSIFEHRGVWQGHYRHIDCDGNILDTHQSRVECIFPEEGPTVYLQKNSFTWDDGREYQVQFPGVLRDNRIYWDTETFCGYGWVASPNVFLLELQRKDVAGASFYESIVMGANKNQRARTWHWFKDGECYQRTLCDERLVD